MKRMIAMFAAPALAATLTLASGGCESKERVARREEAARVAAERDAERERLRAEKASFGQRRPAPPARPAAPAGEAVVDFSDAKVPARAKRPTFADPRQEEMYRLWLNIDYPTQRLSDAEYAIIVAIGKDQASLDAAMAEREAAMAELEEQRFQEEQQAAYEAQLRRIQAEAELRARVQLEAELQRAAQEQGAPVEEGAEEAPAEDVNTSAAFPRSYN